MNFSENCKKRRTQEIVCELAHADISNEMTNLMAHTITHIARYRYMCLTTHMASNNYTIEMT